MMEVNLEECRSPGWAMNVGHRKNASKLVQGRMVQYQKNEVKNDCGLRYGQSNPSSEVGWESLERTSRRGEGRCEEPEETVQGKQVMVGRTLLTWVLLIACW